MNERAAKVTILLAVLYAVPAMFCFVGVSGWRLGWGGGSTDLTASLVCTLSILASTIWIWRKYIRWTYLRSLSTFGVGAIVVGQVLVWTPLWGNSGCTAVDNAIIESQSLMLLAFWLIGNALTWWGGLLRKSGAAADNNPLGGVRMSLTAFRLTIGLALMLFLPGLFWFWVYTEEHFEFSGSPWRPWRAYLACAVVLIGAWIIVWLRAITWNRSRRIWTFGLALALLASTLSCLLPENRPDWISSDLWGVLKYITPLVGGAIWLAGTALVWRMSPDEERASVSQLLRGVESAAQCPNCNYELTGLREVRCPECGWSSTVDDVVARTMQRLLNAAQ